MTFQKGNIPWNIGKHPSKEVRYKIGSANRGKKSPFNTRIKIECAYCGKEIIKKKYQIEKNINNFCNSICHGKWLSKEMKNGNIKMKGMHGSHTQKSKDKIRIATKGENNPNYKGGITPILRSVRTYNKYKEWREKIYLRDNYTCQICGKIGGRLQAHHIISFSKIIQYYEIIDYQEAIECKILWDINNGITLCKKCHDKIHSKEFKEWAYFYIRGIMYNKTGVLLTNENIIDGLFTMGYSGDSEESYALEKG